MANGNNSPLTTAVELVGLLAGVIAGVYVLGGVVLAIRLLFDGFAIESVVALLGQLPKEFVISTGLVQGIAPALLVGIAAALAYGVRNGPGERGDTAAEKDDHLDKGPNWQLRLIVGLPLLAVGLAAPAIVLAIATDGWSLKLLSSLGGVAITYALVCAGWFVLRRLGRRRTWYRLTRALAAGAVWAAMALVPAVMFGGAAVFDRAAICTDSENAERGSLIADTGDLVIISIDIGDKERIVSLRGDRVNRVEYGDVSAKLSCPSPSPPEK